MLCIYPLGKISRALSIHFHRLEAFPWNYLAFPWNYLATRARVHKPKLHDRLVGQRASGLNHALNADIKRQAVAKRAPLSKDVETSFPLHSLKKNLRPALYLDLGRTAPIHN